MLAPILVIFSADWNSFNNSDSKAAQELGSDVQMLAGIFTKLMSDKVVGKLVKKEVKTFSFINDAKDTKPSVTLVNGTFALKGNYSEMNWDKMEKGIGATIKEALMKTK